MKGPDISVVIPTFNREQELMDTVRAILNQSHANLELVVLDQGKSRIESSLAKINDPRLRYFKIGPPSLPAARNFGLKVAKAPILLFLDDDIVPVKDLVKYHLLAFQKHPGLSAVGGRVLQDGFPIKKQVLSFDKHAISHGVFTATEPGYTNAFPGGNHSLKVADALRVGGYDTRYYRIAFREESDMALKMSRAGMKIYYEPRAEIFHLNSSSGGLTHYVDLFDTLDFYRNDLFFVLRSVGLGNLPGALYAKYMEYCHQRPLSRALKRTILFKLGFWTALRRLMFGRQIISREIPRVKIGIDARPLQHETQYRGIGKSLEFLLLAFKNTLSANDSLIFYVDAGLPKPAALQNFPAAKVITVPTSRLGRKRYLRSVLSSFRAINPTPQDIDVLLQNDASFGVPRSVPTVVAFLDLIPHLFRGQEKQRPVKGLRKGKDALARSLYWKKYLRVLKYYKKATAITAISQSSKNDLLKYFPDIPASRVTVIHLGTNALQHGGSPGKNIIKLSAKPYLLYVGGIDTRKNIIGLLKAFYELKPAYPELRLITVGKEFELKDRLEDLGWFTLLNSKPEYAKDVVIPGFVSSADLHYLYQKATVFVFASRYEGFGLPVLEAMQAGCPVIAYDNSSIPEVAGNAALLVKDGHALTPAISKLLDNPKLRKDLIAKGYEQAARFSWDDTAKKTLDLLRKVSN